MREALRRPARESLVLLQLAGPARSSPRCEPKKPAPSGPRRLETFAVTGAMNHLTDRLLDELDNHLQAAAAADDLATFIDADVGFHRTVWSSPVNELVPRLWLLVEASIQNLSLVSNPLHFANFDQIAQTLCPLDEEMRDRDSLGLYAGADADPPDQRRRSARPRQAELLPHLRGTGGDWTPCTSRGWVPAGKHPLRHPYGSRSPRWKTCWPNSAPTIPLSRWAADTGRRR